MTGMCSRAWPHCASVCCQHLQLITLLPWCEGSTVMCSVYVFNILVKLFSCWTVCAPWWEACPLLGQNAAVPYMPFGGDLSNYAISRWPKPCQLGHVPQGLVIVCWWQGAAFQSCDGREPSSTAHPPEPLAHNTAPTAWFVSVVEVGFHRQRLEWQRDGSVTGLQQCLFSSLLSWLLAAFFLDLNVFCKNDADIFYLLSFFPSSLQSEKVPAEQSQGEAEELHQCLRAGDCCVCFPFLVHFSNSLDIQLDPTWTEVVVFCWPVLLKLQRYIMFWIF